MISLRTNVDSLIAQRNLSLDNQFQSNTIQQLTSGYRINKSGDDAAGLAIANGIQSQVTQLNQGVKNANDGVSQLQIVDGGLSNISSILNRLQTLATQSASTTFTGNRATLNQEYTSLLGEISRQATNINLNSGGTFNNSLSVYIGGGVDSTHSSISINLGGGQNAVDAASLGLINTNVLGGGVGFAGNTQALNGAGAVFLNGSTASESFSFNLYANGSAQTVTATVNGAAGGITATNVLSQLNSTLNSYGITAGLDSNGQLNFSGSTAFNVKDTATTPSLISSSATASANNTSNNLVNGAAAFTAITGTSTNTETLNIQAGGKSVAVSLNASNASTLALALSTINAATAQFGVNAVLNSAGTGIQFQGSNSFTVQDSFTGGTAGVFAAAGNIASTAPTTSSTTNATSAISAINSAIATLGLVQGVVGAAENTLSYAIGLAQSQISSFSSAESNIKDADVAAQAANLSKSQVLTQTAVAALAQANSEPQSILKLLQ